MINCSNKHLFYVYNVLSLAYLILKVLCYIRIIILIVMCGSVCVSRHTIVILKQPTFRLVLDFLMNECMNV